MQARRRARHQVVLQLMPGAEPWMRVERGDQVVKLPASCSVLELWELLEGRRWRQGPPKGEIMVRVPLDVLLASPTIGAHRRRGRTAGPPRTTADHRD